MPRIRELLENFVPAADEVGRLQRGEDRECRVFQEMAEHGHYRGRVEPSNTRQGIYALAPSGRFLASCNTRSERAVRRVLEKALRQWETLGEEERLGPKRDGPPSRWVDRYPEDGLILQVHARDLARTEPAKMADFDWRRWAWNSDYAWFRRDEARQLFAENPAAGARHELPAPLVERLVCLHLVDNVRGQVSAWESRQLVEARLASTIAAVADGQVSMRLEGRAHLVATGDWHVDGFAHEEAKPQERGLLAALRGDARYDLATSRFVSFRLVATGDRWGGTRFNARGDDLAKAPLGVAFTLAPSSPQHRVAPAFIWRYGW